MTVTEDWDARRKKLYWRATHRGIKEMDILMGSFAAKRLLAMTDAQLDEFEQLIDIPDQQLLSWVVGEEQMPASSNQLLQEFLRYRP